MTRLLLVFIFFLLTVQSSGQIEQLEGYKNLFTIADSLNKSGKSYYTDSLTILKARSLDRQHPSKYFEKAGELFRKSEYYNAAFVYYLGILRYRYYNAVNPKYQASGDGALAASLQYVTGEMINLFLKTNIVNFITVLKSASHYFSNNDFEFYSRTKNPAKYEDIAKSFSGLIHELETNRAKFEKQWDEERKELIDNIDEAIEEYNKLSPEEKSKLKASD